MKKLILMDFSWLYNKYYYVAKYSMSFGKCGQEVTGRILENNLLKMLLQFLSRVKKSYESKVILALDSLTSDLNNFKIFEGYKQNRDKKEKEEVYSYFNTILESLISSLDGRSFSFIKAKGYESDQILAYIVKKYHEKNEIIVYSGDKDLLQLSSYPNVYISDKFEKGSFIVKTDEEIFSKFKNSRGEDFSRISKNKKDILKYRVLRGDTSDNLSAVYPRIKDKEIAIVVKNWTEEEPLTEELAENIINRLKLSNVDLANKLEDNKENWFRNYKIMDLLHVDDIMIKRIKFK